MSLPPSKKLKLSPESQEYTETKDGDSGILIYNLPTEVLVHIFNHLNFSDVVKNCSNTCIRWRDIIVEFFMEPQLRIFALLDDDLKQKLLNENWNNECKDSNLIKTLWDKFKPYKSKLLVITGDNDEPDEPEFDENDPNYDKLRNEILVNATKDRTEVLDLSDSNLRCKFKYGPPLINDHKCSQCPPGYTRCPITYLYYYRVWYDKIIFKPQKWHFVHFRDVNINI